MEMAAKNVRDLKGDAIDSQNMMHKLQGRMNKDNNVNDSMNNWQNNSEYSCFRCGGKHNPEDCRFRNKTCHKCGKNGHISRVCRSTKKDQSGGRQTRGYRSKFQNFQANKVGQVESEPEETYNLLNVSNTSTKIPPYQEKFNVNGQNVDMEIDTGASLSVINHETYESLRQGNENLVLKESKVILHTYTGERVSPLGILEVTVKYGNQTHPLPLLVLASTGPNLCGRNWLENIRLDWSNIRRLGKVNLEDVLKRYGRDNRSGAVFRVGNPGSTHYQARWECEVMRGLQTDRKLSFSPRCISDTQDRGTT
jgi:predicted aspartyl protease